MIGTLKQNLLSHLFALTTSIWVLRLAIPEALYFFLPLFFILLLFTLSDIKTVNNIFFFEFIQMLVPLFILLVFYLWGIAVTGKFYKINFIDLFEFTITLLLVLLLYLYVHKKNEVKQFIWLFNKFLLYLRYFVVIISMLSFFKHFLPDYNLSSNAFFPSKLLNTNEKFFGLFLIIGLASFLPLLIVEKLGVANRVLIQFFIVVVILALLFSFSSLFLVVLVAAVLGLLIIKIYTYLRPDRKSFFYFCYNLKEAVYGLLVLVSLFVVSFFFYENTVINQIYKYFENDFSVLAFDFYKWQLAIEIYSNSTFLEKIFGSGFNYLSFYGTQYSYPHNPILSALLYSGIIGAFFTFIFMFISLFNAFKHIAKYPGFGIMIFSSAFFILFSGNSFFSISAFLFFFSLSFLIEHFEVYNLEPRINLKKRGSQVIKEIFDLTAASIAIVIFFPLLSFVSFLILVKLGRPIFFTQKRIGKNGKTFLLHKFRTMSNVKSNTSIAANEVDRISPLGKFLRKYKIDELPELINIIRGEMSFVGPRPDVPGYADKLQGSARNILELKPGLTGPASLKYRNEEDLLQKVQNPQRYNDEVIFPDKVRINLLYMKNWSFLLDILIIFKTLSRASFNEKILDDKSIIPSKTEQQV